MRCLGQLGCAVLLIVFGAAGWHFRDVWYPHARGLVTAQMPWEHAEWAPITVEGAERAEARIRTLDRRTGPAFVNIAGADFVAYALRGSLAGIHEMDSLPEALVDEGQVYLRMRVRLTDLGGSDGVGAVAGIFGQSEMVTIAGRLSAVGSGMAQYLPTDVAVKDIRVPVGSVTRLLGRWSAGVRAEGIALGAMPVPLPPYIGDLRVGGGRITLYKAGR